MKKDEIFNWIPCSNPPDVSDYYLACIYDTETEDYDFRKIWFAYADDYDIEKSEWRELYENEEVTAWTPLPMPYELDLKDYSYWKNKVMGDFMKGDERLVL